MKTNKRLLSLFLATLLLFSLSVPALAAERENVPQYKKMLVFGDSITCAFGLKTGKSFGVAEGSYADLVAKAVGASPYTSLAFTGCCIAQVMYMVGLDIDVADIENIQKFLKTMPGSTSWERYDEVRRGESEAGDIEEAIGSSDLIMLAIGANDLGSEPFKRAYTAYTDALKAGSSESDAVKAFADMYVEMLNTGLDYFMAGYPQILHRIREINPDADIILVGSYNPFLHTALSDELMVEVGSALTPAVRLENEQLKLYAQQYDCIYADVYEISERFPTNTIARAVEMIALDTHPDYDGHAWMADQILDALCAAKNKEQSPVCEAASAFGGRLSRMVGEFFSAPLIEMLDNVFDMLGSLVDRFFNLLPSYLIDSVATLIKR